MRGRAYHSIPHSAAGPQSHSSRFPLFVQVPQLLHPGQLSAELRRINTRNKRLLGLEPLEPAAAGSWAVGGGYQHAALLLDWARAVCAFHGVLVADFATSFADGRVMCLLVRTFGAMLSVQLTVTVKFINSVVAVS